MRSTATALGTVATALALTLTAAASTAATAGAAPADPPPVTIDAVGDGLGGHAFTPATATASMGQLVVWTNRDFLTPHTVTEAHGLFDLAGDGTGATKSTPGGFGPGASVQLRPASGTYTYLCRVHPGMTGELRVPVSVRLGPRYRSPPLPATTPAARARRAELKRDFQRRLTLTWSPAPPPEGQVFDVQIRRGSGPWKALLTRTLDSTLTIRSGQHGTTTSVRARLRLEADATQASGWSPVTTVAP